jgi:hypothetical protein
MAHLAPSAKIAPSLLQITAVWVLGCLAHPGQKGAGEGTFVNAVNI